MTDDATKVDTTPAQKTPPRHARFFSEQRVFDATKDDHLLDALQQSIEVAQDCGLEVGFTIRSIHHTPSGQWLVEVTRPGDDAFVGQDVREALREAFNAE